MIRQWLKGPEGDDYLLIAGKTKAVARETETAPDVVPYLVLGGLGVYALRGLFKVGGRVEVRWRDDVWAWSAENETAAVDAARELAQMLATGAWVPQRMPQPTLPGADIRR
jgi:hypothetical protein